MHRRRLRVRLCSHVKVSVREERANVGRLVMVVLSLQDIRLVVGCHWLG